MLSTTREASSFLHPVDSLTLFRLNRVDHGELFAYNFTS
jgi:hypothetical protein